MHQHQTCGVLGCSIFSNLHLVCDLLDYIDKTNEPAILVTLDQEKAFDRVDHEFMLHVLQKFGFGPSFFEGVGIFMAVPSPVFSLMVRFLPLFISIAELGRVVPYLLFFMFWYRKFSQHKSIIVMILKASCSLGWVAFNLKYRNTLMMPLLFLNLRISFLQA